MDIKLCSRTLCTGCGACAASCSHNAIKMDFDKNGFLQPFLDRKKCVGCHLCEKRCPILNMDKLSFSSPQNIKMYTGWTQDDELCSKSSSGGIFSQVAHGFLENEYPVVGVVLDEENRCHHTVITKLSDLDLIIGTKYIQSEAYESYREIKERLKNKEKILFCGTPCQIAGLLSFVGGKQDNLYTIELLCHGVTSKKAVDIMCDIYGYDHVFSYRNKVDGWCLYDIEKNKLMPVSQRCTYKNAQNTMMANHKSDLFYMSFGKFHRHSCYNCKFAKPERLADITLGDQWGLVSKYMGRLNRGASLIILNTYKGHELLESSPKIKLVEENLKDLKSPPFFMPAVSKYVNIGDCLWMLKYFPLWMNERIMQGDAKRLLLLVPYKLIAKIGNYYHKKKLKKVIESTRLKYNWK